MPIFLLQIWFALAAAASESTQSAATATRSMTCQWKVLLLLVLVDLQFLKQSLVSHCQFGQDLSFFILLSDILYASWSLLTAAVQCVCPSIDQGISVCDCAVQSSPTLSSLSLFSVTDRFLSPKTLKSLTVARKKLNKSRSSKLCAWNSVSSRTLNCHKSYLKMVFSFNFCQDN